MRAFWLLVGTAAAQVTSSSSFTSTTTVTARNGTAPTVAVDASGSTFGTLSITTDAKGDPVYVGGPGLGATTTISIPIALNATKTVYGSASSSATAAFSSATSTVPSSASASTASSAATTITKYVTTTDTHIVAATLTTTAASWNPMDMTCARQPFDAAQPTQWFGVFGNKSVTLDGSPTTTYNKSLVLVVAPTDVVYPVDFDVHQRRYAAHVYQWVLDAQNDFNDDIRSIFMTPLGTCRLVWDMYDWVKIDMAASTLSACGMSFEQAMRYALAYEILHNPSESHRLIGKRDTLATTTIAVFQQPTVTALGCGTTLTSLPTVIGNTYYVPNTTLAYDYAWAAAQTPIPKPPSCRKGPEYDEKECKLEWCMVSHHKPLDLTTMYRAVVMGDSCPTPEPAVNWITHTTSVTGAHWGTTTGGMYCPARPTVTSDRHGKTRVSFVNEETPRATGIRPMRCNTPPSCWDNKSCCAECRRIAAHEEWWGSWAHPLNWRKPLFWIILLSILLPLLIPCLCCCGFCGRNHIRNRRRDPNSPFLAATPFADRFARRRGAPGQAGQTVVTTTTTGSGGAVDPVLAAAGGAAAANALNEKSTATTTGADAGDGRGTVRRQVEEGRGKVQFADDAAGGAGHAAGQGGEQVVTTVGSGAGQGAEKGGQVVTTTAQPAKQVVTSAPEVTGAPAHHDGAADGRPTGSQPADMGSMRGRKKSRPGHELNGF